MKHEQASEEAKQKEENTDHGKLTFEDRILLVTSKHEALESTKKELSLAGMASATARGREGRGAKAWDVDADHDRGGRRNREHEGRDKTRREDWKRRDSNKEERSRSRERDPKPQSREESGRRGRGKSPDRERARETKPPREKEIKGAAMSEAEIGRAVDNLPVPVEGACETCRGTHFPGIFSHHHAAGNHPNCNPNGHKRGSDFVSWQDWMKQNNLYDEALRLGQ
jgi:hypothetical protein